MPTARHPPNARKLLVLAAIVSTGLFLYGAAWSIGHGGDWEESERTQPRAAVRSAIAASIVTPNPLGPVEDDWPLVPANWRLADGNHSIVLADRTGRVGRDRYCAAGPVLVVAGTSSDYELSDASGTQQPSWSDIVAPHSLDVLAELDRDDCFATLRTLITIDAQRRITVGEAPNPTRPVWGYFVLASSWIPFAAAWALNRRQRHDHAHSPT